MRRLTGSRILLTVAILLCAASSSAQSLSWLYPAGPQETDKLIVWIVVPQATSRPRPISRAFTGIQPDPLAYKEQTAGDFGHTAGTAGQTAGSTGTTMGDFGRTAGSVGQTAGSTGKSAGDFQGDVGSKTAGDSGRTMGDFGTSTTDLPRMAAANNTLSHGPLPRHDDRWHTFLTDALGAIPNVAIHFVDVFDDELETRLADTAGTDEAPDVVLGNPLPAVWFQSDRLRRAQVVTLWHAVLIPQAEQPARAASESRWPDAAILIDARNPQAARAFALWVEGHGVSPPSRPPGRRDDPLLAALAERAVQSLAQGSGLGDDADPEIANQGAADFAASALAYHRTVSRDPVKLQLDIVGQRSTGNLGVVAVRLIGSSRSAFGVLHALVVLRRNNAGRWRVLQISPTLTTEAQTTALNMFRSAAEDSAGARDAAKPLKPVSQASPPDGDTRSPQPQLWWDSPGGSTLQVVEWQERITSYWTPSDLFFVPDADSRLRTQVQARFAAGQGQYRWRVWSVGNDGTVVLSAWRTFTVG